MSVHHLKIYVRLPCQGIYSAGSVDIQPVCYEADMEDSDIQEVWLVGICAATSFHDGVSNFRNW
jgi:hypothetical protein